MKKPAEPTLTTQIVVGGRRPRMFPRWNAPKPLQHNSISIEISRNMKIEPITAFPHMKQVTLIRPYTNTTPFSTKLSRFQRKKEGKSNATNLTKPFLLSSSSLLIGHEFDPDNWKVNISAVLRLGGLWYV